MTSYHIDIHLLILDLWIRSCWSVKGEARRAGGLFESSKYGKFRRSCPLSRLKTNAKTEIIPPSSFPGTQYNRQPQIAASDIIYMDISAFWKLSERRSQCNPPFGAKMLGSHGKICLRSKKKKQFPAITVALLCLANLNKRGGYLYSPNSVSERSFEEHFPSRSFH